MLRKRKANATIAIRNLQLVARNTLLQVVPDNASSHSVSQSVSQSVVALDKLPLLAHSVSLS